LLFRAFANIASSRNFMASLQEEILTENIPTDDLILFGEADELTRVDRAVMKQFKDDQTATKDVIAAAVDKVCIFILFWQPY
jgi:hypothetical protein